MNRHTRTATAALLSLALLVTACGDDDDTEAGTDDTETTEDTTAADPAGETSEEAGGEGASDEGTVLDLTLGDDGLTGVPDTFPGGAVDVTVVNETADEHVEVNFTRVDEGTSVEQFAEEFVVVFEGGAFPDFVQANSGVGGVGTEVRDVILVEPGTHIVWFEDGGSGEEGGPSEIVGTLVEVTEGEVTELPETDGEIVARDYTFDVDVSGSGTFAFRNEGPDQHHHAVIVDFGTNAVEVVEEAIEPLLMSDEDEPPPDIEGFDAEQVNFDFAGTGVFGPGLAGTFEADFVSGNTYAVVCFISDRSGGPPHAMGMEMYEVFTVS